MARGATVTDVDLGWKRLRRELETIHPTEVVVGIRQAKGAGKHARRQGREVVLDRKRFQRWRAPTAADLTIAEIATVHEFGSADGRIPERSFMRSAFDENREKYVRALSVGIRSVVAGRTTLSKVLGQLGARVTGDVQRKIRSGPFKPNAPMTIALKGSSKPLVDSGRMRSAVDFEVRLISARGGR